MKKKKKAKKIKPFDVGAYELFNNKLYIQKNYSKQEENY
jgi:hypothetical protein